MDAFQRNQSQFQNALAGAFSTGPFAEMARRNMELFQAATGGTEEQPGPEGPPAGRDDEIERLRTELANLQAKVEKLVK
jgi:polyhydroxyalkanoate synthesis regulator protein